MGAAEERMGEYELRDMLREGLDHMYLHNLGGTPDETYMRIKSEPLDDWAVNSYHSNQLHRPNMTLRTQSQRHVIAMYVLAALTITVLATIFVG